MLFISINYFRIPMRSIYWDASILPVALTSHLYHSNTFITRPSLCHLFPTEFPKCYSKNKLDHVIFLAYNSLIIFHYVYDKIQNPQYSFLDPEWTTLRFPPQRVFCTPTVSWGPSSGPATWSLSNKYLLKECFSFLTKATLVPEMQYLNILLKIQIKHLKMSLFFFVLLCFKRCIALISIIFLKIWWFYFLFTVQVLILLIRMSKLK